MEESCLAFSSSLTSSQVCHINAYAPPASGFFLCILGLRHGKLESSESTVSDYSLDNALSDRQASVFLVYISS